MAQITYTNKVALNENPEIADINKVTDDDMNEIKSVVNNNYNKTIQITSTQPTDSDNKIWIDTGEIAQAHTEITNSYSTSTGLGYSANYVNNLVLLSNQTVDNATFYKIGKLVVVNGWFVLNASTGSFTAPYKPIVRTWAATNGVTNTNDASSVNGYINISTSGSITITMTGAVTYCTTSFCYITND